MSERSKKRSILKDNTMRPNPYNGVEYPNVPISSLEYFTEYFNKVTRNEILPPTKKYFCVMLFTELYDVTGDQADIGKWVNTKNTYFHNGTLALDYYANTPCPASQLIDAMSLEELMEKRNKMLENFKDEKFLDELYETL